MRIKFYTNRPFGIKVRNWLIEQGEEIVDSDPELIISCYNPYIIPKEELTVPAINFHPGLLPHNRGMYPHIWPLVDGSPAGVTIHWVDPDKLDGGDIISQKEVPVHGDDTAGDLEQRTQYVIFKLFKQEVYPALAQGTAPHIPQKGEGSYHKEKEITTIQQIPLEIANKLRACTFSDRSYAYFIDKDSRKRYIGIKFFTEDDIKRFDAQNHA